MKFDREQENALPLRSRAVPGVQRRRARRAGVACGNGAVSGVRCHSSAGTERGSRVAAARPRQLAVSVWMMPEESKREEVF